MNGESRAEFVIDVDTVQLCWGENLTETYHRVSHPIQSSWGGQHGGITFESWQFDGYAVRKHTGEIVAKLSQAHGLRDLGSFKTLEDGAEAVIDFTRARLEHHALIRRWYHIGDIDKQFEVLEALGPDSKPRA